MDTWVLNGIPLGSGTPDVRVFLSFSTIGAADPSITLIARRAIFGTFTSRATSSVALSGKLGLGSGFPLTSLGRATALSTMGKYLSAPISLSATARASSSIALVAQRAVTGATTGQATSATSMYRGTWSGSEAIIGLASGAIAFSPNAHVDGAITAAASSSMRLSAGLQLTGAASTNVTTSIVLQELAGYADDDRISRVPADNRITKVV